MKDSGTQWAEGWLIIPPVHEEPSTQFRHNLKSKQGDIFTDAIMSPPTCTLQSDVNINLQREKDLAEIISDIRKTISQSITTNW
jgi:hypothetical protein